MIHDLPLALAAALYMVSAALLYHSIGKRSDSLLDRAFQVAVAGGVLHFAAQVTHRLGDGPPDVSIAPLLSLCALVCIFLLVTSSISQRRFFAAGLVALPIAAVAILAELFMPHEPF